MLSTVLIIDKRKELPAKYKKSIDNLDANAIIARTLKEGIQYIQNLEPDMIIISDSIDESLTSFCGKVRALTYNFRPIIIALSKSADFSDRISVLESGADDFLSEPVNIDEFKTRIKAHLRRDIESHLDNKTLLPNEKFVRKTLKRVLSIENQAVLMVSIENLDSYKTVYSEIAADKILQTFVAVVKSAIDKTDFIGQLDETKFIITTSAYSAEKLAAFLAFAFDTVAPKFYSESDIKRGYLILESDRYAGMRSNFVSIQIGGILDGLDKISNVDLLLDKLNLLRKLAKTQAGSNYTFERAKLTGANSVLEDFENKNVYIYEPDESLRYLIRTALELQGYDVQESLDVESAQQPSIIIMDSGDDFEEIRVLKELKENINFVNTKLIVTTSIHDKATILDSGADLYLPKPYEIADLIKWVAYLMNPIAKKL